MKEVSGWNYKDEKIKIHEMNGKWIDEIDDNIMNINKRYKNWYGIDSIN